MVTHGQRPRCNVGYGSGQFEARASGSPRRTCLGNGDGPARATGGALRLRNGANGNLAWRNAGNTADLTLGMDASDRLALAVGAANLTTSATAGAATALPATPATYITIVCNGQTLKVPAYAV